MILPPPKTIDNHPNPDQNRMKLRSVALIIASSTAMGAIPLLAAEDQPAVKAEASAEVDVAAVPQKSDSGWLGIGTRRIPRMVAEHLGVPPGTGLSVEMVAPGSPAEKAGLKKDDVIAKLNDQVMVNQEQLAALVQATKPGQKVKLQLLRDEAPVEVEAEVGSRPAEFAGNGVSPGPGAAWVDPADEDLDKFFHDFDPRGPADPDRIDKQIQRMRERMEAMQKRLQNPPGGNGVRMQVFRFDNAQVQINDDKGSITIHTKDGKSVLTAKDKDGNLMYEGPYDTDEEKAKVPPEVRQRADHLKIQNMGRGFMEKVFPDEPDKDAGPKIDGDTKPGDKID